jgi:SAM-dependent methyltransferase
LKIEGLRGKEWAMAEWRDHCLHSACMPQLDLRSRTYAPVNHRAEAGDERMVATAVENAWRVFDGYREHVPSEVPVAGARVLEVGPGSCGAAVLLACNGARVTVIDRYLARWQDAFHRPFFTALLQSLAGRPGLDSRPIARLLYANDFVDDVVRRCAESAEACALPDASFDLVLSHAVLEHIEHVPTATANLCRVTRPGGYNIHLIDFADHRDYSRPLEYLSLDPELFWAMFDLQWGECGNRWRETDFRRAFEASGCWPVVSIPVAAAKADYLQQVRPRLHADFSERPDADLSTLCAWVVARRDDGPASTMDSLPGLVPSTAGADYVGRLLADRRVVIYGAGSGGWTAWEMLERLGCTEVVAAVCDSDPRAAGRVIGAHAACAFDAIDPASFDTVIVATAPGLAAITDRLSTGGWIEERALSTVGFLRVLVRPDREAPGTTA